MNRGNNNLDFIRSIVLNEQEIEQYNLLTSNIPTFRSGEKDSLLNVTPLYRLALVQNSRYSSPPMIKTVYDIKNEYPNELKLVLSSLNQSSNDDHRKELLALKGILMQRYYSKDNIKEATYEEFMIKAGYSLHCVNCSSTNVTIENKSNRSADEPTETFYKCQECKKEFRERIKFSNLTQQPSA